MKKLMLMLGAATALTASAINPPKQLNGYLGLLPDVFTANGKEVLTIDNGDAIVAYNGDLDVIATVNRPKTTEISSTYWFQNREWAPKTLTLISTERTGGYLYSDFYDDYGNHIEIFYEDVDYAVEYLKRNNGGSDVTVETLNGKTIIVTSYRYANYGQKYAEYFYRFEDGRWWRYKNYYEEGEYGYYGEWGEKYERTETRTSGQICDIEVYMNGVVNEWFSLSQTLFNSDSQFEYVVKKLAKTEFSIDTETQRTGGEKIETIGYSIMDQNGNKLFDIDIPAEYRQQDSKENSWFSIYMFGGKKYFVITCMGDGYDSAHEYYRYNFIYELDSKSGVKAPKIVKSAMSVSPAAPRHGEIVTVDLGSEATAATMVNIVSTNGSTVRSLPVSAGQRNISLSTAGLASGLYVVSANGHEAAKIIIR